MERAKSIIEQNGVVYYLEGATTKVIEKYDENLRACLKDLDYHYINGYEGNVRELDLSWISKQDVIDIKTNPGLSRIYLNCTNTKCAALKTEERIVCDINVDCNIVVAGSALKRFLANNYEVIDKINFHNVSNLVVKKYLEDLGCAYGIEVEFVDFGLQLEIKEEAGELVA